MATAEHEGVWLGLVEPERAAPCIPSVMDEPVRVRARALRPFLRVLCSRCWLDARARPWDMGCCCAVTVRLMTGWQRSHVL